MNALLDALFSGDPPSLVLSAQGSAPGSAPASLPASSAAGNRAGLGAGSIRKTVADWAARLPARPAADRLRVLEGLALLWHDHWDAAHEIAQSREGDPDHDLLHAMLHRREGDFANAGYWFGGSGKHPCYPLLARRLASLSGPSGLSPDGLKAAGLQEDRWSARIFLAAVRARIEGARGGRAPVSPASPSEATLVLVQAEEFRAFAACLIGS